MSLGNIREEVPRRNPARCPNHLNWLVYNMKVQWLYSELPVDVWAPFLISKGEAKVLSSSSILSTPPQSGTPPALLLMLHQSSRWSSFFPSLVNKTLRYLNSYSQPRGSSLLFSSRYSWPQTWRCWPSSQPLHDFQCSLAVTVQQIQQNHIMCKKQRSDSEVPKPDTILSPRCPLRSFPCITPIGKVLDFVLCASVQGTTVLLFSA